MKRMMTLLGGAALIASAGCAQPKNPLEPAPTAQTVPGNEDAVTAQVEGAQITAVVDAWPGDAQVLSEVTPVRMTIQNTSGEPIRLQYRDFQLVTADGTAYRALPPFQIEGDVQRPVAAYGPIAEPGFDYTGFEVAPYYGAVYPGIGVYDGFYDYDPYYYDTYYRTWYEVKLPTREMIMRALPEGVINAGGSVSGFVYFEKVPEKADRAQLRADLVNARTGQVIGTATIPFVVAG